MLSPLEPPAAVLSASANMADLDLDGWTFAPAHNDRQCVQVSLELGTLCRLLTCPCSQDERDEMARRLILEAQERLPDAPIKNLFTSLGRESWEAARHRKRREREAATPQPPQPPPQPDAAEERELMAAELAHFTAMLRKAVQKVKPAFAGSTKQSAPPEPAVEAAAFQPDVLRAGKAHFTAVQVPPPPADGDAAASAALPAMHGAHETAVRYCQPTWAVPEGGDGTRVQATLRFEPGVGDGDTVIVAGPDGEHLPLLTPPGVRNVQRVLASVPVPAVDPTEGEAALAASQLLLDIVPLGPSASPNAAIVVDGVSLILPSYAAPLMSLVIALDDSGTG